MVAVKYDDKKNCLIVKLGDRAESISHEEAMRLKSQLNRTPQLAGFDQAMDFTQNDGDAA